LYTSAVRASVGRTVYTIKEAAARTGVGAPLIRAWERRYGVVNPTRTPSGYRLYDDETLRVLVTMRTLVDSGWTASEAARAIAAGEVPLEPAGRETPSRAASADAAARVNRARMIDRFVAAAEAASATDTAAALDEILASGSFEAVVDDVLLPAAPRDLRRPMRGASTRSAASPRCRVFRPGGPLRTSVVVGLPPGARHDCPWRSRDLPSRRRFPV